ncbi:hypothetical protein V6N13_109842 [Hibiscus sabdariffa]
MEWAGCGWWPGAGGDVGVTAKLSWASGVAVGLPWWLAVIPLGLAGLLLGRMVGVAQTEWVIRSTCRWGGWDSFLATEGGDEARECQDVLVASACLRKLLGNNLPHIEFSAREYGIDEH